MSKFSMHNNQDSRPGKASVGSVRISVTALLVLASVVLTGVPAFAHHAVLSGALTCTPEGKQLITWTLSHVAPYNKTMTVSDVVLTPASATVEGLATTVANGVVDTSTTTLDGDFTGSVTLSLTADWPSHPELDYSATVQATGHCLPKLTVTKTVQNSHGGSAAAGDFPLFVNGLPVQSGAANSLNPGSYTVTETNLPGYVGTFGGDCSQNGTVTLAAAETKTCTLVNQDQSPTIRVVKVVNNSESNGGSAVVADFPLFVDGGPVTSGDVNPFAVGTHTVSETNKDGYEGTIGGDCAANGTVTLAFGDNKTCVITNDDQSATLEVIKVVVNDNGGTAEVADFPLTVDGDSVTSGDVNEVSVGSHTVAETNLDGYVATFSGDCNAQGAVTLGFAEHKSCTITNDDTPTTLVVEKIVVNDNTGTLESGDFQLDVAGSALPETASFAGSVEGHEVSLNAGSYSVSEEDVPGYAGTFSEECSGEIEIGDPERTCTVTNIDLPPGLTVIKHVVNNNGGTRVAGDFQISVSTEGTDPAPFAGSETGTLLAINPGPYAVTEQNLRPYAGSLSEGCTGTIALGEARACIIVNDDAAAEVLGVAIQNTNPPQGTADFVEVLGVTLPQTGVNIALGLMMAAVLIGGGFGFIWWSRKARPSST
jgi:LPXTG-motif cell wall-anchored protein